MIFGAPTVHAGDTLFANLTSTRFPGSEYAYGGGLLWLHAGALGGVMAGGSATAYPVGTLDEFDVDGYRVLGKWSATAGASIGRASSEDTNSTLEKARLLIDYQLSPKWTLHGGDQYIRLDQVEGQLASASAEFRFQPQWGIKASGGYGISGTLADRYVGAQVDWYGPPHLFAGLIDGRTGYDPANLGQTAEVRHLFQIYACAAIPVHKGSLQLSFDDISLQGQHRQSLRIGFSQPVAL